MTSWLQRSLGIASVEFGCFIFQFFCWYKKSGDQQLRLVLLQGFFASQVVQDFWTINSFTFDSSLQNWACAKLPTYLFHLFFRTCAIGKVSSPESQSGVRNCCQATICQTNMSQSPDLIRGWYWDCWPVLNKKIFKDQIRKCTSLTV